MILKSNPNGNNNNTNTNDNTLGPPTNIMATIPSIPLPSVPIPSIPLPNIPPLSDGSSHASNDKMNADSLPTPTPNNNDNNNNNNNNIIFRLIY